MKSFKPLRVCFFQGFLRWVFDVSLARTGEGFVCGVGVLFLESWVGFGN